MQINGSRFTASVKYNIPEFHRQFTGQNPGIYHINKTLKMIKIIVLFIEKRNYCQPMVKLLRGYLSIIKKKVRTMITMATNIRVFF